jgi:heptosyltransferase-1
VERAILFDKKHWPQALPSVLKELQSEEFDIALDLQRLIKSGLFCLASKSARRIGFDKARCKEFTWLFPFERIAAADPTAHMAHQYLDFARYLGANPSEIRWDIPITGQIPLDLPKKYVVLNIGATTSAKRWSAAGFASLASGLLEHYAVQGVLTGGPVDTPMAQEIESLAGGSVMNLVGRTSFQDLAEIISGAAAVVTCDTGPMHLAVALGKEVIALIGPTNPKRTGPLRGRIIRQDLDCMPCNQRQCENPVCMRGISAEMVLDALEEIL